MQNDPQTYKIIGAALEVHNTLGSGFLENVYQYALANEFSSGKIPFEKEVNLQILYKNQILPCYYKADFVCFESIIVELKALNAVTTEHEAQVLNYLKATNCKRALFINFGRPQLQYKRLVHNYSE
ncbi:MAG: GxxExxY protein [Phycisphaerae bacterium]|nr:GxxExxY protein [Phycisphaerae bacterium]